MANTPYGDVIYAGSGVFSSGLSAASITVSSGTVSGLTETRLVYAGAGGLLSDSANMTFDGINLHLGTITLGPGGLIDSSGAISFGNENLSTTGEVKGGTGHFGGATHYAEFEADGTLKFNGDATVWKDVNLGSAQVQKPASSAPSVDTFTDNAGGDTDIATLAFGVGDKVGGTFELQHDYAEGTNLVFHVHYQCDAAPTGTDYVAWEIDYTIVRDGATMPAVTNIDSGDDAVDTQYEQIRADWAAIDGTSLLIGDQISFKLARVAAVGDAYAGTAKLKTVGIHYEIDTVGSRAVTTK